MINPYEAPQSVDLPPPVASVVCHVPAEYRVLSIGTAQCAGAGRLYLLGTLAAGVVVLFQISMNREQRDNPAVILPLLFCLVASVVLLGWGMFKNLTGIYQLRNQLPNSNELYAACLHACWLKVPIFLSLLCKKDFYTSFSLTQTIWEYGPNLAIVTIWLWTIYWHTCGMNSLVRLLGVARPRYTSMLYSMSGGVLILAIVWVLYLLRWPLELPWYLVMLVCLALHCLAYTRAYQQISTAFQTAIDA